MSYIETHLIRTCECDMYGRWKPSSMFEAMQEVAIAHCEAAGLGRNVTDGLGVAWVISRCRVELSRQPVSGEEISIETYAMPTRHLFFPRCYVLRDASGNTVCGAYGLWVLLDLHTRKIVANPFVSQTLPLEDREMAAKVPATVQPLNDAPVKGELTPQFTEFDLNGHVNNAKYLDWCWNALGFDALRDRQLSSLDINYEREALRGEVIRTELCMDGDAFSFCGHAGDKRCFGVSGQLLRI